MSYTSYSGVSIMENTIGFYPMNVGSIPARRTKLLKLTLNTLDVILLFNRSLTHLLPRSSEEEQGLDKAEVDISKLSVATKQRLRSVMAA